MNPTYNTGQTQAPQDDEIDLLRLAYTLFRRRYWLIAFMTIGIIAAWLTSKILHQKYTVDTSIVVPQNNQAFSLQSIFESQLPGATPSSVYNEIEVLKSYTLNHRVMEKLNWRTVWFEKELFNWKDCYTNEPFIVQELSDSRNMEDIDLDVTLLNDSTCLIEANGTGYLNNEELAVDVSETVRLGESFRNEYFNFVLHPATGKILEEGQRYRFRFQGLTQLTDQYLKKLNVSSGDKNSEVIRISSEGTAPMREIHYLNELIHQYMDLKLELQTRTQNRSLSFIDKQLSGISDSLSAAGSSFSEFRSKNQLIDVSAQGNMVIEQLNDIEKQRSQERIRLDYFENLQNYLNQSGNLNQLVSPSVIGIEDPNLNALVVKLSDMYSRREVLAFSAKEGNPTLVLLNREISQANKLLRENLVNLIDNANRSITALDQRYDYISGQLNNLPGKEQQLINIRRQYEMTNEIYTYLLQRRAEIEISLASTIVDVQIIDPARIERIKETGPSTKLFLLVGAFLGFLFPAGFFLLADGLNAKIESIDDIARLSTLPVIGQVLHNNYRSNLPVYSEPTSPLAESYRNVRTNLQFLLAESTEKIIGIHSVVPGEGKTFTTVNLACVLAMNDKKVLIIGADIRKPRLQDAFNLHNNRGLSSYLAGNAQIEDIITPTGVDHLFVILSGPVPPNPSELLSQKRFEKLLNWTREQFDYILIDNAPISLVTDGLLTAPHCDRNLFVLRHEISQQKQIRLINEFASKPAIKHTAILLNDVKASAWGSAYGYGYGYGYGYTDKQKTTTKKYGFPLRKRKQQQA